MTIRIIGWNFEYIKIFNKLSLSPDVGLFLTKFNRTSEIFLYESVKMVFVTDTLEKKRISILVQYW